jgi:hypothetical protein
VPTPFYHLHVAETLLSHPELPEPLRLRLAQSHGAFLLGNTAPDVQVISGQERQATHFFTLPIRPDSPPAWERFLVAHPSLANPAELTLHQSGFIAGYLCHLQADWMWIGEIFAPVFGPACDWGTFPQRLYLHNVLRAYLDRQILAALPAETAARLKNASPDGWLPFVEDRHLHAWRDWVAGQLEPGAEAQTVEVFAARQGVSPAEFYQLLGSPERMEAEVFFHLPRQRIEAYRQQLIRANLALLRNYLAGEDGRSARPAGEARRASGILETTSFSRKQS